MSDPFAVLYAVAHAQFGVVFTVERTGDITLICIDESPEDAHYGGNRAPSVQVIGEILPDDYAKVTEGDYLQEVDGAARYKIVEIMPEVEGSKDLYLKKSSA